MGWVSWPRWRSVRRRVADLEQRIAALEAERPVIVQVGGGLRTAAIAGSCGAWWTRPGSPSTRRGLRY